MESIASILSQLRGVCCKAPLTETTPRDSGAWDPIPETVLLDLDDTIVDFTRGLVNFLGVEDPYEKDPSNLGRYDVVEMLGMTPEEVWGNLDSSFWSSLQPLPHMNDYLDILETRFGKENICILTKPIRTPGCVEGKVNWIKNNIPEYSRRFLIGPAKQFCAAPNRVLIDDSEKNERLFRKAGGQFFLSPSRTNYRYAEDPATALREWIERI